MKYSDFIGYVRSSAQLNSSEEAVSLARATLETLGELLYRTEREKLGAQLPGELKSPLYSGRPRGNSAWNIEDFTVEEFYTRVSKRADIPRRSVVNRVSAVMDALTHSVSQGELEDIFKELPQEYRRLGKPLSPPASAEGY